MKISERRIKQLKEEGIDYNKSQELIELVIKKMKEENFTLKEARYWQERMGYELDIISKRSPEEKISSIIQDYL